MTLRDLEAHWGEQHVRPDAVCLCGGLPDEEYIIECSSDGWRVYYIERGQRSALQAFASEAEACEKLLRRVLHDKTSREPSRSP